MMTIADRNQSPDRGARAHQPGDPATLALGALGWILTDDDRAGRLLATTGLDSDTLRDHLTDPGTLAAVLEFLANHEPDLLLAADALGCTPQDLVAAHRSLSA